MEELLSVIRHWLLKVWDVQNSMLTTTFLTSGALSIQVKWWSAMKRLFVYNLTCGDGELSAFQWADFTFICRRLLASGVDESDGAGAISDIHLVGFVDMDAYELRTKISNLRSQLTRVEDPPLNCYISDALMQRFSGVFRENARKRAALLAEIQALEAAAPTDGLQATLEGLGWKPLSDSEYSLGEPLNLASL